MTTPIDPVQAATAAPAPLPSMLSAAAPAEAAPPHSFPDVLSGAFNALEARVDHADALVRAFVVDDSIPIHQVTIALEEARLAVELAVQVRTRVIEGYREIMGMQI